VEQGIVTFLTDYGIAPVDLARAVEERGFAALFLTEHTHIPVSRRTPWPGGGELPRRYAHTYDPFVGLAAAAVVTDRITLGTAVSLVAQHDPIVLAKTVASVDRIAGGRFELGVGSGWNREEMANHGVDPASRTTRMLEHVAAMRAIWSDDTPEFHGRFVDFDPIWSWPKPSRVPPVLIGGGGPTVLDRVLSHGDGWIPLRVPVDDLDDFAGRVAQLRRRAEDAARGPLPVTVYGAARTPTAAESYAGAGVDRVLYELGDHGDDTAAAVRELDELAALLP
jgi:probable F420-dependent oxidoreductase